MNGHLFNHPDLAALTSGVEVEDEPEPGGAQAVTPNGEPEASGAQDAQTAPAQEASPFDDVTEIQIRREAAPEEAAELGVEHVVDSYQVGPNGVLSGPRLGDAEESRAAETTLAERAQSSEAVGADPAEYQAPEDAAEPSADADQLQVDDQVEAKRPEQRRRTRRTLKTTAILTRPTLSKLKPIPKSKRSAARTRARRFAPAASACATSRSRK